MIIEIIIVSILLISDKKKQKEIVDNKVVKEKIDSVIDIEKEIINQKKISSKNIETTELKNLDTDPRTRPLPNLSFE